jgi:EmrB/QacA subfamily drug resistance transporter
MQKSKLIPLIVACALIMQTLDATIVTTALPQIAIEFATSPVALSMCITAYLLSMAVFIPVSGWVADRFGARFVFCAAIALFTLGSLLCGISQSPGQLTAARALQGIGGAMMVPVGRLVLLRSITKSELVTAMAYLTLPAQIGPVLGPVVGGFITSFFSWRWIFLLNLPIGLVGIVLALHYIKDVGKSERRALDWVGFLLSGIALSSLMFALESIGHGSADAILTAAMFALGFGAGLLAVLHAQRCKQPLLDLKLLRIQTFRLANGGSILFRTGAGALPFLLPLLFQGVLGMTAFHSGLLIAANPIGSLPMKLLARPILQRLGFRRVVMVNGALSAAFVAICGWFGHTTPLPLIIALLMIGGFFQSLQFTALQSLTYADVPPPSMSTATSLASMVQQLANGFGVAIAALLLQATITLSGGGGLSAIAVLVACSGVALIGLLAVPLFTRMPADSGAEVSGHVAVAGAGATSGED